jgi:D-alanyl-D-alanine carboxypeptidase/D-alanyl-D-alanine-endopeptidase (penicillin-binding protein 4)
MLRRIAILAFAIAPIGANAAAQLAPDERIRHVRERPEFARALWGTDFSDLGAKKTVSTVSRDQLFVPDSTTKLVTTGTALELLGADHRFRTRMGNRYRGQR